MMDEQQIQHGRQWLEELLRLSGLDSQVDVDADKLLTEGSCWLTISDASLLPEQLSVLTGERGTALDAIQYLANTTLNLGRAEESQIAYTIELAGYRVRRQAELQALAEQAMQHVRETGEEYEMTALSSAERRQVHTYLQSFDDLETYSRGKEPDRRLVVRPV
jgi:spoIIIJ-associated protein